MKKIKKFAAIILCIALIFTAVPLASFTANAETDGYYTYTVTDGEATITSVDASISGNVTIPSTLSGYPVTSIGNGAFYYCSGLTSIIIPNSVTSIGNGAFEYCTSLTSITIPYGVTSIGDYAFYNCSSLTSITIPDSVTSIGNSAFGSCSSLESITLPFIGASLDGSDNNYLGYYFGAGSYSGNSSYVPTSLKEVIITKATIIGDHAFYNCSSLTSITIPDSVTSIGEYAFFDCSSLTSITIPDSVTSIGNGAFEYCSSLTSITIPDSVTSIGKDAYYNTGYYNNSANWENNVLYIDKHLIDAKTSLSGSYAIKKGTKTIASYAFSACSSVARITLPDTVTSIGDHAFYNCSKLTSITLPDSITSIGSDAFYNCSSLTSITIPDSITSIGSDAFYNCSSLTSITIPDSVTSIGDGAFYGCKSLTSVTLPDSVTSIGDDAFSGCNSLTNVYITDIEAWLNIKFDDYYANPMCYAKNLLLNGAPIIKITIPDSVTSIGNYAFYNCSSLTSITIPDSVTSIGYDAFYNCSKLTSINIPDGVTSIGDWAFNNCSKLTSINIPDGVTSIGDWAFNNCSSLTSITIPNSVTSIGGWAFRYCTKLKTVYYCGTAYEWKSISIGSDNTYLTDAQIKYHNFGDWIIKKDATCTDKGERYHICSVCGNEETQIINESHNFVSGVCTFCKIISENQITYTISNGEATITDCDTSVRGDGIIPSTLGGYPVTSIGDSAFYKCSSLTSITIPDSVTSIDNSAFYGCSSLTDVYITDIAAWFNIGFANTYSNPMSYAENLYVNNKLLLNLEIPQGIEIIGKYQFYSCLYIKNVFIPKSVVLIKESAFRGCDNIKNIYFEGTAEEWAEIAVLNDTYIQNANIYYNCTGIPSGVMSVTVSKLPNKVKYIQNEEYLDLSGGILTLNYDCGVTQNIDLSTVSVSGFDNTILGEQTITVKYGEFSTTFKVNVINRPVSFVTIANLPQKTEYRTGEALDLTGGKIVMFYGNGDYEFFDITADMVSGYNPNKVGVQILTVTYNGFASQLAVTVSINPDLNGDGEISADDVLILRNALLENNNNAKSFDINGDGKVNVKDLVCLKRTIAS